MKDEREIQELMQKGLKELKILKVRRRTLCIADVQLVENAAGG